MKKIDYQPVSRILCPAKGGSPRSRTAIIYLVPCIAAGIFSAYPPRNIAVVSEQLTSPPCGAEPGYTWHFSMQGLPVAAITYRHRGLLPHVFILTLLCWPKLPGGSEGEQGTNPPKADEGSNFLWPCLSLLIVRKERPGS